MNTKFFNPLENNNPLLYHIGVLFIAFSIFIHPTLAQQSVLSAGGDATGSNGSVSFSVGQVFFHSFEGTGGTISEGVQQPYEIYLIISVNDLDDIKLILSAFPNPVSNQLQLRVDNTIDVFSRILTYQLFDIQGRLLLSDRLTDQQTPVDMSHMTPGVYFLNVSDDNVLLKTFKVIKK